MKYIHLINLTVLVLSLVSCKTDLYNNADLYEEVFGSSTGCRVDLNTGFAGGDGSEFNPYQICSRAQFVSFANKINSNQYNSYYNKHFALTRDIDLGGPSEKFYPIGKIEDVAFVDQDSPPNNFPFQGSLNGNGFMVYNISIAMMNYSYVGLFQYLGDQAVVRNLNLEGTIVISNQSNFIGSVAGYSEGIIDNVNSQMTLSLSTTSTTGGLVGRQFGGEIKNSSFNGLINIAQFGEYIGGVVGYASDGLINNVSNNGILQGDHYIGGILGVGKSMELGQVINYRSILGKGNYIGGIAGRIYDNSLLNNVYNYNQVGSDDGEFIGGLVGSLEDTKVDQALVSCSGVLGIDPACRVKAKLYAGGIAGICHNVELENIQVNRHINSLRNGTSLGCAYSENLKVVDSDFEGMIVNEESFAGGLSAFSVGSFEAEDVTVNLNMSVTSLTQGQQIGMLIGQSEGDVDLYNIEITGVINNCRHKSSLGVGYLKKTLSAENIAIKNAVLNCSGGDDIGGLVGYAQNISSAWNLASSIEINNVTVSGNLNTAALFGHSNGGVGVFDVVVEDLNIISNTDNVGVIFGQVTNSTAHTLVSSISIDSTEISGRTGVGGIVGDGKEVAISEVDIVDLKIVGLSRLGGVAGRLRENSTIVDSRVHSVEINKGEGIFTQQQIGGVVGYLQDSSLVSLQVLQAELYGLRYLSFVAAEAHNSFLNVIRVYNGFIAAEGHLMAGISSIFNASTAINIRLDGTINSDPLKNDYVAGGFSLVQNNCFIGHVVSTLNLLGSSANFSGGVVASDAGSNTYQALYYNSDNWLASSEVTAIGLNSLDLLNSGNYSGFNFNSPWLAPTALEAAELDF